MNWKVDTAYVAGVAAQATGRRRRQKKGKTRILKIHVKDTLKVG